MDTCAIHRSASSGPGFAGKLPLAARLMTTVTRALNRLGEIDCDGSGAWRDPLSHPALRAMSLRELGDLPLSMGCDRRPPE